MLRGLNKDKAAYARAVLKWLNVHAPEHASELNTRGIERGWWDQVNYFRITYKTPQQCAESIATIRLNDRL